MDQQETLFNSPNHLLTSFQERKMQCYFSCDNMVPNCSRCLGYYGKMQANEAAIAVVMLQRPLKLLYCSRNRVCKSKFRTMCDR